MPAEPVVDVSSVPPGARQQPELGVVLGLLAVVIGAVLTAVGVAKLLVRAPMAWDVSVLGGCLSLAAGLWTLRRLQLMPVARDDCERYGRHLFGLTYLLLVVGLCMAVGASCLALDGGLALSTASVIEASDPKRAKRADEAHEAAADTLKSLTRSASAAERAERDTALGATRACALAGPDSSACEEARRRAVTARAQLADARLALAAANENLLAAARAGASARENGSRALFLLLALSMLSSLFGASFYVVDSVRRKRPSPTSAEPAVHGERPHHGEPFDVHTFWSGVFFRVGEAVLFTLTFFTLIWSSDRRDEIVWLPALGLFVGMFVKTAEVVISRLGTRVLSAADALLPPPRTASQPAETPPEPSAIGLRPRDSRSAASVVLQSDARSSEPQPTGESP